MDIQRFFDNFQLIASSSSGIVRLKNLILTMAIRGKLIKQNLKDKSSFEQIKLAKEMKLRLIKEKKIKSEKPLTKISQFEIGYDVPSNWAIARIGEILTVIRGASPRPKDDPRYFSKDRTEYHWVKISDINKYSDGWLLQDTDEFLTKEGSKHSVVLAKGTLVLTNSATVGVPVVLGFEGGCIHDGYLAFPFLNQKVILQKFLYYYFLYFREELEARAYGMAQVNINTKIVRAAPITLPPIKEQKRIVAKVEELMAICDQLEEQRSQLEEIRQKFTKELLDKIIRASTNENLLENWQILQSHFLDLFVTSEAISSLKQAIVQLGVEGKLGTQVDAEESAQDLLIKLEREYVEKLRAKNADKRISIKAISEGEVRFTYPSYWQIVRLGQLVLSSESGWSPQCDEIPRNKDSEWGILKVSAVTWDKFLPHENKALPKDQKPKPSIEVKDDDFLISRANTPELVAKSVVVINTPPKLMMSDKIIRLNFSSLVDKKFYNLFNNSKLGRTYYENHATGTSSSMRNVSRQLILNMPVTLPPLNEQRSIVVKVEKLLALCEYLNETLKKFNIIKQKLSIALLESVLHDESVGKITVEKKEPSRTTKNLTISIEINLSMGKDILNTKLAKILGINGGTMEAKELWKASALKNIDEFYALLKQEIEDGFIQEPDIAELKLVETDE